MRCIGELVFRGEAVVADFPGVAHIHLKRNCCKAVFGEGLAAAIQRGDQSRAAGPQRAQAGPSKEGSLLMNIKDSSYGKTDTQYIYKASPAPRMFRGQGASEEPETGAWKAGQPAAPLLGDGSPAAPAVHKEGGRLAPADAALTRAPRRPDSAPPEPTRPLGQTVPFHPFSFSKK